MRKRPHALVRMGQISSFMADIADEFKIVVVDAIRSLCLKCVRACVRAGPLLHDRLAAHADSRNGSC